VLDLRAAPLEGATLPEALRTLVQQTFEESAVRLDFEIDSEIGRLPPALETGLYRIAQEALANMRKYAQATQLRLQLRSEADRLRLAIADNGVGFDLAQVTPTAESGFGIKGMSERAHLLGGTLEICSAPGAGTCVVVHVPYRATAKPTTD
jgi:two-component system, NarL family, sensor kinase